MKLTKRTFITQDTRGCDFTCEAYYGSVTGWTKSRSGKDIPVRDCDFYGMGLHAKTLSGIKELVGRLP